jgi:hypothetical protein
MHPMCVEVIKTLELCHKQNTATRYLGACNQAKRLVNDCLALEKRQKQLQGQADGKRRAQMLKERMEEFHRDD